MLGRENIRKWYSFPLFGMCYTMRTIKCSLLKKNKNKTIMYCICCEYILFYKIKTKQYHKECRYIFLKNDEFCKVSLQ